MKKGAIITSMIIVLLILGILFFSLPENKLTTQESLALKFDKLINSGCYQADNNELEQEVGGTLISIGESRIQRGYNASGAYSDSGYEYDYLIILKGKEKTQEFTIYKSTNETPEYNIGSFYKFNFLQAACSHATSNGPHGGVYLFQDENSTVLQALAN